jgi:hypothetical protein
MALTARLGFIGNDCIRNDCIRNDCIKNDCIRNDCIRNDCIRNDCWPSPSSPPRHGCVESAAEAAALYRALTVALDKLFTTTRLQPPGCSNQASHGHTAGRLPLIPFHPQARVDLVDTVALLEKDKFEKDDLEKDDFEKDKLEKYGESLAELGSKRGRA